jgi:hypothetical protein
MKLFSYIALFLILWAGTGTLYGNNSLPDNTNPGEVIIYPNPVSDGAITLKSDQKIERVEILNILGQIVQTEDLNSVYLYKMNLELQSGIYLIRVIFTNNSYSTKRIRVN